MQRDVEPVEVVRLSAFLAEREARERAERQLAQLRDDEDSAGAECSRLECDQLDIHDALTDAGAPGAINAQNIIERIERLVADRDAAVARAEQAEAERDRHWDVLLAYADALLFYADESNYDKWAPVHCEPDGACEYDKGRIARAALSPDPPGEER